MLRVDVTYEGEEGIGVGPTQDFFASLTREFCAKRLGLWRDESKEGDLAWTARGIFPAPNAPPEQFYFIGLLVGKALLMDVLVPFPFNPAFFKLILGQPVDAAEVDPMLAQSLANPEGLIGWAPFTYPGIPTLELVPGGANVEVSSSNVAEFVGLVKKRTVELGEIVDEFRRGLSTVVQWELLKLFTPKEIDLIICGELPQISREDLVESVEPSHGYTAESPQISMFFDVVAGLDLRDQALFIKFVTGMDKLPFGGLKALNPQLTVAPRRAQDGESADATLPSVMTCANYFKLPMYSSKEMMRERILKAVHECQDCFMLT
jgi:E3 ubiquitin-protein ligase TRIP12